MVTRILLIVGVIFALSAGYANAQGFHRLAANSLNDADSGNCVINPDGIPSDTQGKFPTRECEMSEGFVHRFRYPSNAGGVDYDIEAQATGAVDDACFEIRCVCVGDGEDDIDPTLSTAQYLTWPNNASAQNTVHGTLTSVTCTGATAGDSCRLTANRVASGGTCTDALADATVVPVKFGSVVFQ